MEQWVTQTMLTLLISIAFMVEMLAILPTILPGAIPRPLQVSIVRVLEMIMQNGRPALQRILVSTDCSLAENSTSLLTSGKKTRKICFINFRLRQQQVLAPLPHPLISPEC